ncbi:MAG TPA: SDR family NAD(P)-dependent oxidoreductase [Trueperaceae bacterium]|nr:SDR family NAD(P)-dependent oxidoreductase [Trueperaceae bacterium]
MDKVALVTGGGTGIGREIALTLARSGADIAVCGLDSADLELVGAEVRSLGRRTLAMQADVSREEDVHRVVASTVQRLGGLDILVNNASVVGQVGPVSDLGIADWERTLAVNLTGPMLCSRAAIRHMRDHGGGSIVNVSSNVARRGVANRAPYVCSKWALNGLTQTLAIEVAQFNIRVNAICPGPVMTDRLRSAMEAMAHRRGITFEELHEEWVAESPMQRFATAEECAKVVLFLAGDESSAMTGQALNVTAGMLMS